MRRLERDRPSITSVDTFRFKELMRSAGSPHVIMVAIMIFMMTYGLTLFLFSIVHQLGFSPNKTQLMSVGPFSAAFSVTLTCAFLSDRYTFRGIPITLVSMLAIAGFAIFYVP